MADTLAMLKGGWKGESADDFSKKTDNVRTQLLECADDLNKIAGHIHYSANRVYQAEMLAIGLIR